MVPVPADIAPPEVVEVARCDIFSSLARSAGRRYGLDGHSDQVPPQGAEGVEEASVPREAEEEKKSGGLC
ncbi:MAG: hypothetical protein A3D94_20265 [Alphaproteobacteria bacterium RIFCSPHIGHO2_12_FULL_66_14]|nr:MAG: hypothetical protein A3D94_20265 [Alphaproteobacteria bacterium RIFCSPHIGHO2_12_FULL_66_14]